MAGEGVKGARERVRVAGPPLSVEVGEVDTEFLTEVWSVSGPGGGREQVARVDGRRLCETAGGFSPTAAMRV